MNTFNHFTRGPFFKREILRLFKTNSFLQPLPTVPLTMHLWHPIHCPPLSLSTLFTVHPNHCSPCFLFLFICLYHYFHFLFYDFSTSLFLLFLIRLSYFSYSFLFYMFIFFLFCHLFFSFTLFTFLVCYFVLHVFLFSSLYLLTRSSRFLFFCPTFFPPFLHFILFSSIRVPPFTS